MQITAAKKTRLRKVKELCDLILGAYVMQDYDIVIALLHKVAYHYVKICETESSISTYAQEEIRKVK